MAGLDAHPTFPVGSFYTRDCSAHGLAVTNATVEELGRCAMEINRLLAAGKLNGRIDRLMPLSEAANAHRLIEQHATKLNGKLVLLP